jgi:hypothetical protein
VLNRSLIAAAFLASTCSSTASVTPLEQRSLIVWDYGRVNGMDAADFNGDGIPELAFTGGADGSLVVLLGRPAGQWKTLQALKLDPLSYGDGHFVPLVWARTAPQLPALVMVQVRAWWNGPSNAIVLEGWPLRETRRFGLNSSVNAATIADANGDGSVELITVSDAGTFAHRLNDGTVAWSIASGGADVLVGPFGSSPVPRIIVAGAVGRVFDGSTKALVWSYPDGFGAYLTAGTFEPGGPRKLVGARDWDRFTVFGADPWSPLWDFSRFDIDAVASADLDGDGVDEIILGDGQWGGVNAIDAQTRTIRFSVELPGHGTAALAAVDVTGDGNPEIVFAPRSNYGTGNIALRIANGKTGGILHDLASIEGGARALAVDDLFGDGIARMISTSTGRGGIALRDMATGVAEWISPESWNANDPFYMTATFVRTTQLDADPAREVVLAGEATYDGRIVVFDPVTKAVQRQIGTYASGPMRSRGIRGAELFDFDGDGRDDLVVATEANTTGASGVKLHVFSLLTGEVLWESVTMGSGFANSRGVLVLPAAPGTDALLIAALPTGLRAYNARTRLLEWTLEADVRAAALCSNCAEGTHFLLAGNDGQLRVFDAATRTLKMQFEVGLVDDIRPLPGQELLLKVENRLRVIDMAGKVLAESGPVGSGAGSGAASISGGSLVTISRSQGVEILAGTAEGFASFLYTPGRIFGDGFE